MKESNFPDLLGLDSEATEALFRHLEVLKEHGGTSVNYEMDATDLWILHGVLCLGAGHPGFDSLSEQSKAVISRFRGFCKGIWMGQGLTSKEAEILDNLRVHISRID